jgi:hypothetical protein
LYKFDLRNNERILKKGLAAMHQDGESLSGALYLTNKRLVFVGYIHGKVFANEKSVELGHIREIIGGRTLMIIPNELKIVTESETRLSFIVSGRNEWIASINQSRGKG